VGFTLRARGIIGLGSNLMIILIKHPDSKSQSIFRVQCPNFTFKSDYFSTRVELGIVKDSLGRVWP
jgi:hypothetical protein